ncbi:MAG: hypothetical protein JOZ05_25380 [Acetobacteraceae bacterium]|nr:hypothetical protein [Acetobacteraceae bacterium]
MSSPRRDGDINYEALRGDPVATIDNLLRWERIKLREAAQQAIRTLETGSLPTREYLDYMFGTDVGMRELRVRMAKLRERIAELEAMKADAAMEI